MGEDVATVVGIVDSEDVTIRECFFGCLPDQSRFRLTRLMNAVEIWLSEGGKLGPWDSNCTSMLYAHPLEMPTYCVS